MFKIGEIRELIRLLDETSVSELEVESGDSKLHIKKPDTTVALPSAVQTVPALSPATMPAAPVAVQSVGVPVVEAAPVVPEEPAAPENVDIVTSPMVGTFYRSPSPDAEPYAEIGSRVTNKSVVCIVEAMKLMNEIEAETSGVVVEILADNGQLVEYGQPLFKIQRA